jgi:hypothetical protein
MSSPTYARLVSRVLVPHLQAVPVPAPTPEARTAAIQAVARAISARARKRLMFRWSAGLAVAAAFAVVVGSAVHANKHLPPVASVPKPAVTAEAMGILAHPVDRGSSVTVSGTETPLDDGRRIPTGSRVVTPPAAHVALTLTTGTKIVLDGNTDMTVRGEGSTQAFQLDAGAIDLKVAKLKEKERFLVNTPDTEVEVRGTQFRVSVVPPEAGCGGGAQTRVIVTEGVVVVRRAGAEVRVAAGEQWPTGCARAEATEPPATHKPKAARVTTEASSSTLNEQNDLYATALAAKSRGDVAGALDEFDRFLRTYPTSPLAESAMVERMRLLESKNRAQAEDAAIEYLTRYPKGSAHAEAEAVVRGSP